MSLRNAEIARQFQDWLQRYSPPQGIKSNPKAMQAEAEALLKVVLRFAPQDGYNGWVDDALTQCAYAMKTRAWPTVNELGAACSNRRKEGREAFTDNTQPKDDVERFAARIHAKQPVGDAWLYGRNAWEMMQRGLVTDADLQPYRSALFFAMRDNWGQERAIAVEAELKRRHELARDTGPMKPRDIQMPSKRDVPEVVE